MKLQPYEKYKDSGIEWLGEIPAHWEVRRVKDLGLIKYGLGQPPRQKEGGLPIIRATNIERGKITMKNLIFVDPEDIPYDRDPILKEKDIIVVRSGAYTGDSSIIPKEFAGAVTGYDMVFRPQKIGAKFVSYAILSTYVYKDQLVLTSSRAAQPHLNKEELGTAFIITPLAFEQTHIAAYLDRQTALIDQKVSLLQQKVDKYQELKKSLINEAVCRGLDKNVPMKDSGVEWIGEVPGHWGVRRVKDIASLVIFKSENAIRKIGLENIEGGTGKYIDTATHFEGDGVEFRKDDLLFGKLRPYLAKVYLAEFRGKAIGDFFVLRCEKQCFPRFLFYRLLSKGFIDYVNASTYGAKMPRVNWDFMSNIGLPVPSYSEQIRISNYLDRQNTQIENITANIQQQIETLQELRKTLINDIVTGKLRISS